MSDPHPPDQQPSFLPPPEPVADRWQERLEVVALLLLASVAVTVLARLVGAYDQTRAGGPFAEADIDLVGVVRLAGQQTGLIAAGAVLVAFLLVTLGPGDRISQRVVLALRLVTVIGLVAAGLAAFAAVATIFDVSTGRAVLGASVGVGTSILTRLSTGVPLLLAAAIAGYTAWCAFSTLGEVPPLPVAADPDPDA